MDVRRCHQAFTLRELALTVALIAIVTAILFPVFARHRECRQPSCPSNLKMIGIALLQYSEDFDQHFPATFGPVEGWSWRSAVHNYVKNYQVFSCSSDPEPFAWRPAVGAGPETSGHASYGANAVHCAPGAPHAPFDCGIALTQLAEPSSLLLFGEIRGRSPAYLFPSNQHGLFVPQAQVAWRHHDGSNVAFADGHVKWLTKQQVPCTDEACVWGHPSLAEERP